MIIVTDIAYQFQLLYKENKPIAQRLKENECRSRRNRILLVIALVLVLTGNYVIC